MRLFGNEINIIVFIIYRIMVVVKVKTEIMASITSSMIEQAVKLVILYAETFTANVIVFIGNVALTSYCPIFFSIRVSLLIQTYYYYLFTIVDVCSLQYMFF
jgi:hypothetical protein